MSAFEDYIGKLKDTPALYSEENMQISFLIDENTCFFSLGSFHTYEFNFSGYFCYKLRDTPVVSATEIHEKTFL